MKVLRRIPRVNEDQISFGAKFGLDLRDCTVSIALARIEDMIDMEFHGVTDLGNPTQKQVELAAKFGHDIFGLSRREGNAVIDDLMHELNLETIEAEGLAPDVTVINIHDRNQTSFVISSILSDGTCYFRGGNGKRAWARNLRRTDNSQ